MNLISATDSDLRHGVAPVTNLRWKLSDPVNTGIDVDITLLSTHRRPAAARPAAFREERPRDAGAELVVDLGTRVIRHRGMHLRLVSPWPPHTVQCKETVVGGDKHGRHTEVIESAARLDYDRNRRAGVEQRTRAGNIQHLRPDTERSGERGRISLLGECRQVGVRGRSELEQSEPSFVTHHEDGCELLPACQVSDRNPEHRVFGKSL